LVLAWLDIGSSDGNKHGHLRPPQHFPEIGVECDEVLAELDNCRGERFILRQPGGFVPFVHFEHLVDRFASNHGTRHFRAWNHFLCIAYSQLTRGEGLRDPVACLNSQRSKLYHIEIRGRISRSALADANERRDWRLFESLGHRLIAIAVELHQGEDIDSG
jgi:hypothetical protein